MTVKELMMEVAALGFENEIELNSAFSSAATRAIRHIYTDRAVLATVSVIPASQAPAFHRAKLLHPQGESISLPIDGRAYAFKTSGTGSFTIGGSRSSFSGPATVFRGFCSAGDILTFSGDFRYTVYDLTVYSERTSEHAADIRLRGEEQSFDLSLITDDFLAFACVPTDKLGKTIKGAHCEGSILYLPESVNTEVRVKYRRAPRPILPYDESEPVDITAEALPLLALLTSAYLWLDDDREKAEYYMQLYRSEMASLRRYVSPTQGGQYDIPNGWA